LLPFMTFVAFDLETTGLNAQTEEIIEVAGIKFTLEKKAGKLVSKSLATYTSLVKPERFIPEGATRVNHITNDMVEDAPPCKKILGEFMRFCGLSTVLVAHNAPFDAEFLAHALKKYGLIISQNPIIDSLRITKKIMPEATSQKLGNVAKRLSNQLNISVNNDELHRALYDCEVLKEVFAACLRKRFQESELTMDKAVKSIEKIHGPPLYLKNYI
jgi:DNA polymerase-3 subunit epsilon